MRVQPMHKDTTVPGLGNAFEPKTNTVGVQFALHGVGAVSADVQMVGRIVPDAPTENIGDLIAISGTAAVGEPVTDSVTLTGLSAAQLWANVTSLGSVISFRAYAAEGDA